MSQRAKPCSPAYRRVLLALATGARNLHGYRICEVSQLWLRQVHRVLAELEAAGYVTGEWETGRPEGVMCRRFYQLTCSGRLHAAEVLCLDLP